MKRIIAIIVALGVTPLWSVPIKWSNPTLLSTSGVNSTHPQIGTDQSGNLVSVWLENTDLHAKTKPVNGNWGGSTVLSSGIASSPKLVVDPAGNATAIWIDSGVVATAYLPFNGSWGTAAHLSAAGASNPALSVDPNGDVVAVWTRNGTIESATRIFNQNWQMLPDKLSVTGIVSDSPKVAIGNNGTAVATWHGVLGSLDTIYAVSKQVNGPWGQAQVVSDSMNSVNPVVAVDPNGNAVMIWYAFEPQGSHFSDVMVKASFMPANGNWGSPVVLTTSLGDTNPSNLVPRIAFDPSGNALAVWNISFGGQVYTVQSAVLPANGTWTPPVAFDSSNFIFSEDLAVDAMGNAILAYMDGTSSSISIRYSEMSVGSYAPNQWATNAVISTGNQNAYPRLASSVQGSSVHAGAVWLSSTTKDIGSVYAVTGTGTNFVAPKNPKVVQNETDFSLFKDYTNTVSWQASNDPHLTGYVIYRNGEVIQTVSSGTLQITDTNRDPNVSDTYGIAAFGKGSEQSAIITVSSP